MSITHSHLVFKDHRVYVHLNQQLNRTNHKLEDIKETKRVSASSSSRLVSHEADVPESDSATCCGCSIKRFLLQLPVQFLHVVLLIQDGGDLAVPVATETE